MASQSNTSTELHNGEHIMVAGLSFQVASLFLFMSLTTDFLLAARRSTLSNFDDVVTTKKFRYFIWAIAVATFCIFVRSVFRVAELSGGFHGPLDNQQATYMVLEGVMVITAGTVLTLFHPGPCFAGRWKAAHFFRKSKGKEGVLEGNGASGTELESKAIQPEVVETGK
jgi:RTA1 like protein